MKKMMTLLAVILVAAMSQAASVAWNTGAIKVPNADGSFGANAGSTTGSYLATVTFYLDAGGAPGAVIAGVATITDNSTSALSVLNNTTTVYNFAANTKYWASVFVETTVAMNGGKFYTMQSTKASFTVPGTGNGSINFLTATAMPAKWTVVPEPTSMALLALGAAAVGLRRKFRK